MVSRSPGSIVRVLYDYDYTANDGGLISIKEGEEYLLLKKSNHEWWRVIREGDDSGTPRKPIFVPANYVEEIGRLERPRLQKQASVDETSESGVPTSLPPLKPRINRTLLNNEVQNGLDEPIPVASDNNSDSEDCITDSPSSSTRHSTGSLSRDEDSNSTGSIHLIRSSLHIEPHDSPIYANLSTLTTSLTSSMVSNSVGIKV